MPRRSAVTFSVCGSSRRSAPLFQRFPSRISRTLPAPRTRRHVAFSTRAGSSAGSTVAGDRGPRGGANSQRRPWTCSRCLPVSASSIPRWRDVAVYPAGRSSSATRKRARSHPGGRFSCRSTAESSVSLPSDPYPRRRRRSTRSRHLCVEGSPCGRRRPGRAAPCKSARDPCSRSPAIDPPSSVAIQRVAAARMPGDTVARCSAIPARRRNPGRNSNVGLGRCCGSHYATRVHRGRITIPR